MSIEPSASEAPRTALFGDLPASAPRAEAGVVGRSAPRIQVAQRDQPAPQACDLDALLAADHAARIVWTFVEALDLTPLYRAIRAIEGHAGRPAIDPKILVALWLYATVDGVGSARDLDRLCTRDAPYCWLAGGVGLNLTRSPSSAPGMARRVSGSLVTGADRHSCPLHDRHHVGPDVE